MKKKILLAFVMMLAFALMLAFAVSAGTVHNENTVDYDETVTLTLNDGTVVNIFDSEGNALLWYYDPNDNNTLKSIRTDDQQIKWYTESWGEVTGVSIAFDDEKTVGKTNFAVVNMMDDEIVKNSGPGSSYYGQNITSFKHVFEGCKKLEYVYLRLDTTGIFQRSFNGCSSLKYINFEDLTQWKDCRDGQQFSACSSLLAGQVLDLSHTKLITLNGGGALSGVPIKGLILPSTLTSLNDWVFQGNPTTTFMYPENLTSMPTNAFKECKNLQTIYLNGSVQSIGDNAFLSCNALSTICFVGTKAQLETLIAGTSATGNDAFFSVVGENNANVISYAEYLALEDKSGKYAIYDYSYCEAFNNSIHTAVDSANDCTKDADCKLCIVKIESQFTEHDYLESFVYEKGFAETGKYTYICQNAKNCTCGNIFEEPEAIFVANGFSTKGTDGISAGFSVKLELLQEYNRINSDAQITFGVMMVNPKYLDGKEAFFVDGQVNAEKYLQVDMSNISQKNFGISIEGFEGVAQEIPLVMALYVCADGEEIQFIQSQITKCASEKVTVGEKTLYTVTLDSVTSANSDLSNLGDYIMPSGKEE